MSLPRTLPHFGLGEYLAFERGTDARHEYLDGHVYAMAARASSTRASASTSRGNCAPD